MNRENRLNRRFNDILNGTVSISSLDSSYRLFLEAICAQADAATCINRIVSNDNGLKALQSATRINLDPAFLNGLASDVLAYFLQAEHTSGDIFQRLLLSIVEPPIFWSAFVDAYEKGLLESHAQSAFAKVLFHLISHSGGDDSARYRELGARASIQDKLLNSSQQEIVELGHRIRHILSTYNSGASAVLIGGPGGRHDNDAADFRVISILPTANELMCTQPPFLRRSVELEDPLSEETRIADYIDNTFRLLRDDMLHEIREELQNFLGKKKRSRRLLVISGLTVIGLYSGNENGRKTRWGIKLQCKEDLPQLKQLDGNNARENFLEKDSTGTKILRHNSLVSLIAEDQVFGFGTVSRDIKLLAKRPPVIVLQLEGSVNTVRVLQELKKNETHIQLVTTDVPIFAFEPVLKALQAIQIVPFSEELLFWKEGNTVPEPKHAARKIIQKIEANPGQDLMPLLKTPKSIKLDKSQAQSLLSGLKQRVALIQGPPGTGKSFIGALLAKALHDHTSQTILVVCYTNHALDQFLEDLLNIGIGPTSIVRLGGKANAQISHLNLFNQKQGKFVRSGADRAIINDLKSCADVLCDQLDVAFGKFLAADIQLSDIMTYIEFEEPAYFDAFTVPESTDDMVRVGKNGRLVGPDYLIHLWSRGGGPGMFKDAPNVRNAADIWKMKHELRRDVLGKWKSNILQQLVESIYVTGMTYNQHEDRLTRKFNEGVLAVLREKRIIGCTTTGAAKYSEEILSASPDVLLVEEAGEILESHILTALGKNTSHMILIGDHKQLRPKINNYELTVEKGKGFDLNRSLFERLVLKGFPHEKLTMQHRMRPEVSNFVRNLTYPHLVDAPSTQIRENLRGVQNNVIFLDHEQPEDNDSRISDRRDGNATTSKQNTYEVQMVLKIVRYLGQQGYGTDHLVILTPYLGQMSKLRDALRVDNDPILNDLDSYDLVRAGLLSPAAAKLAKKRIRLATVDNYQGEESDIVVVSLTRSNSSHDIGFMTSPERVNVLISRARNGLILIGNSQTFLRARKGNTPWTKFLTLVKDRGHLYDGFPIKCERHPDRTALLREPREFDEICPDGGCNEPCGVMLSCNTHLCPSKCHQLYDHSKMPCTVKISELCVTGVHMVPRTCSGTLPRTCRRCDVAARAKKEQDEKDKDRQLKQLKQQAQHDEQMAKLEAELKVERDKNADAALAKQRELSLRQKEKDVEEARARTLKATQPRHSDLSTSASTSSTSNARLDSATSSNSTSRSDKPVIQRDQESSKLNRPVPKSPARDDWESQKANNGERNSAIDSIMDMTGLEEVKQQILRIKARIDQKKRQGIPLTKERLNLTLLGNPGTGKTTVARLYARFLESVEALPGIEFFETTGSLLAYEGIGKAKSLIDDAIKKGGGAIFVDEAYQLVSEHDKSGLAVLDFLLAEMENRIGTIVFIFAGYNREMEKFFEHNPGLKSRVPYTLQFEDYSDDELLTMFESLVEKQYSGNMQVDGGIKGLYVRITIRRLGRGRGRPGFGNARSLQIMFSKICERQAERIRNERREGKSADDFLFTKEDLIGPNPSEVIPESAPWKTLQNMIGLEAVKESIRNLFILIETNYLRELNEEQPLQMSLNRVFLGSPGTGKTTVAKLYGQILAQLGLLSNGEVVVKNPADFVGAYVGHSEKSTKAILGSTVGKVLVIDEAYMLYKKDAGGQNTFQSAVIDTIVAEVQSVPGEDRCVLLLGYKDQMVEMFQNVNPGLSRRFAIEDAFNFEDFTEGELRQILELKLSSQQLKATDEAKDVAIDLLSRAKLRPNFGNGGEVENMLTLAKMRCQKRLTSLPANERANVLFIPYDFDPNYNRDKNASANLAKLFEGVVGCDDVVQKLGNYQKVARNLKARGMDMRSRIPTSFIFKGPPGTGKTTTARKLGQVFYDMGFLSSSDVIECSASDLVGQYVGHTGPKTKKLFEKALGKVLFIDEAYRLGEGPFAKEAMDELVSLMTQETFLNKIVIILAGYDQEMNTLLNVNPGLSSRFSEEILFKNLSTEQCLELMRKELLSNEIDLAELTDRSCPKYQEMASVIEQLSKLGSWGNARDIKEIAKRLIRHAFTNDPVLLSANDAINIMTSMLSEHRNRSQVPQVPKPYFFPQMSAMKDHSLSTAPQPESSSMASSTCPPPSSIQDQPRNAPPQSDSFKPTEEHEDELSVPRDAGVSDSTWDQLQKDKKIAQAAERQDAERERELQEQHLKTLQKQAKAAEELQKLHQEEMRKNSDADELKRQREAARLLETEAKAERKRAAEALEAERKRIAEQKRIEAAVQQKLRLMGVCVAGFQWIKQAHGYRCSAGGHFVSDSQLGLSKH